MSDGPELPHSVVDAAGFTPAIDAGALDACLCYLRENSASGEADLQCDCQLAEALLRAGRRADAIECADRAFPRLGNDPAALRICAWVFSNCGRHENAAAAYTRLLDLCPGWLEGHRHLSAELTAAGRCEEAGLHARIASDLAPDDATSALRAAMLSVETEAVDVTLRYIDRALVLAEGDRRIITDAAELLIRCGRADTAAALLADIATHTEDARLLRTLSTAEMLGGRYEAALAAVEQALRGSPDNVEYQLHRGHLLWQLGDIAAAAAAFDRAATLAPADRDPHRARLSLFLAAGLTTEATAAGGELLHRFPDDAIAAETVLHLLNHRLSPIDGDYIVLGESHGRAPRVRRPAPGLWQRLRNQRRVINALIIRETRTRFAEFKLGYGWALLEPILHIGLLSATFAILMHGRPPIGRHFFLFYYTGLIPYLVFVHASTGMSHAVTGNAAVLQLPPVSTFDVILARGLLEIATDIVVAIVLLAGFAALGVAALPNDLWTSAMALLATAAFGAGVGFLNAVLTVFWRSWERAFGQLTRVLYFASGIFYVPAMMPDRARDILAWNPLLHAIDWFRTGFFVSYQPHWLDRGYLLVVMIAALVSGLSLQRGLRRRLSVPL